MKVVCIKDCNTLTLNKIYDVVKYLHFSYGDLYQLYNDTGELESFWYDGGFLMTLDEYRESKLNELGI